MDIDVSRLEQVQSTDKKIYESELVTLSVPFIKFLSCDYYFVPVNSKTIHDPLVNKRIKSCYVGTIVGVHLHAKDKNVYTTENDGTPLDEGEGFDQIGKTVIAGLIRCCIATDDKYAYTLYENFLVRIDYIVLMDTEDYDRQLNQVLKAIDTNKMYEEFIKPRLTDRGVLPMILDKTSATYMAEQEEIERLQKQSEKTKEIYQKLSQMKTANIRPEGVEDISAAMVDPFKDIKMSIIKLPEHLK